MKKLLMACGCAAMMISMTGCGGSSAGSSSAFGDSLSIALGDAQGSRLLSDYMNLQPDQKQMFKKDDILRGLKTVVMTDTTQQGYLTGLSVGMQLANQLYRYEQSGIAVNRAKLYEAYAKAFSSDSVSPDQVREFQAAFQALAEEAQQKMMEHYKAQEEAARQAKENAPEAKENAQKGEEYIKKVMADDPTVKRTESGLAYKVVSEGTGEPVGKTGTATVKYKGTLIDGTEFDKSETGVSMSPTRVVPGFGEGLSQMKNGSKYILYIPGNLAYGVDGSPQAGIGPNATLVFEVETSDVKPGN